MKWCITSTEDMVNGGGNRVHTSVLETLLQYPTLTLSRRTGRLGTIISLMKYHKIAKRIYNNGHEGLFSTSGIPAPYKDLKRAVYLHSPIGLGSYHSPLDPLWKVSKLRHAIFHHYSGRYIKDTMVITNAHWLAELLEKHYAPDILHTVSPPCRTDVPLSDSHTKQYALSIGRFSPDKGHDRAVRIAKAAGYPLYICGRGKLPKDLYGTKPEYFYHDMLYHWIEELTRNAKAFVSGCMTEDFGIACVEAMANGCIPVVPDRFGFMETVPFVELRYTTESQAARTLSDIMNNCYDDLIPKMHKHAQKYRVKNFKKEIKRIFS